MLKWLDTFVAEPLAGLLINSLAIAVAHSDGRAVVIGPISYYLIYMWLLRPFMVHFTIIIMKHVSANTVSLSWPFNFYD